ncbi:MAG: response regulator transcription factor [Candidatus Obscuribacterales bacterium]|nr:response regulator transcription factor [Candidatus Obscuribacterales bacterium]
MPENRIGILIVEDQQITRLGLRLLLEKFEDLQILDEADNGESAVNKALKLRPKVVLMDIGLPGIDGIEAARQIKAAASEIRMLMLTTQDHDDAVFASLAAGADGYCLKDAAGEQIAMAIRAVCGGVAWLDPAIAKRVLQACQPSKPAVTALPRDGRSKFALSVRELEVLALIVEGLSNQEIAARLKLSQETVKSHVRRLMEKLVVSDRTQAAVKALRTGLISDN